MSLKSIFTLVVGLASPQTLVSVKAVLAALAALKRLKGDTGEDVTPEQLSALWDAARVEFQMLGDEAKASQAAIDAGG
jgi:hypothetical protein